MRFLKALWLAVFFFFSLVFFIQNSVALGHKLSLKMDFYYFNYVWSNTAVPFYFVIMVGFFAGALLILGYLLLDQLRTKSELRRSRKQVRILDRELKKLREIPLKPSTPLIEVNSSESGTAQQK